MKVEVEPLNDVFHINENNSTIMKESFNAWSTWASRLFVNMFI